MSNIEGFSPEKSFSQLNQINRARTLAQEVVDTKAVSIFEAEFPENPEGAIPAMERIGLERRDFTRDTVELTLPQLQQAEVQVKKDLFLRTSKNMRQIAASGNSSAVGTLTEIPLALRMFYAIKKASDEKRSFGTDRLAELACEPEIILKRMTEKEALDAVKSNVRVVRGAVESYGGVLENQGSSRSALLKLWLPEDPNAVQEIENTLNPQKKKKEDKLNYDIDSGDTPLAVVANLRRAGFLTRDEIKRFREISGRKFSTGEEPGIFTTAQQGILEMIQQTQGITIDEIASRAGISIESARAHVANIRQRLEESEDEHVILTERRFQEAGSYHWMTKEQAEQFEEEHKSVFKVIFGDEAERVKYNPERQKEQLKKIRKGKHAFTRLKQSASTSGSTDGTVYEMNGRFRNSLILRAKAPTTIDEDVLSLSEEELVQLVDDAIDSLDLLVLESSGLVGSVINQKASVDYLEGYIAGLFGLAQAAVQYDDPEFETSFSTYAKMRISGEISDYLRKQDPLTRTHRNHVNLVNEAFVDLWNKNGLAPTVEEIAVHTGLPTEKIDEVFNTRSTRSLDQIFDRVKGDDGRSYADRIGGQDLSPEDSVLEVEYARLERVTLVKGLSSLPEREREVLRLYYVDSQNMKEIAGALGVSETRVSQLHAQAIKRLRRVFSAAV